MIYGIARALQLAGLIILPMAVAGNVAEKVSLRDCLVFSAVGMLCFFVGWLLQKTTKQP